MRSEAKEFISLCVDEMSIILFIYRNSIVFGIINQIDSSITGDGVWHVKLTRYYILLTDRNFQIIVIDNLIMVTIYRKIGIEYLIWNIPKGGWI
ncbi:MAG: hypothetical protein ACI4HQ_06945 [Acetatifactor sp.]